MTAPLFHVKCQKSKRPKNVALCILYEPAAATARSTPTDGSTDKTLTGNCVSAPRRMPSCDEGAPYSFADVYGLQIRACSGSVNFVRYARGPVGVLACIHYSMHTGRLGPTPTFTNSTLLPSGPACNPRIVYMMINTITGHCRRCEAS